MKEEEINALIKFLEEVEQQHSEKKEPYRFMSYEVCIDCREVVKNVAEHYTHTVVLQDFDHSGVSEWIRCLKWLKEKN